MEGKSSLPPTEKKFGVPNRSKTHPHSPFSGNVAFRLLCLQSHVGVVIGKSGNEIKQLEQSTNSKIWVELAPLECPDRVIMIIAKVGSTIRVRLGVNNGSNGEDDEKEEEVEVSEAQYALIRVFEDANVRFQTGTASCRLLMEASHVGGEMMECIRMVTGCKVEIWTHNLPICAYPNDAMVKIEGNVSEVKKALISISSRLQACQPIFKIPMVGSRFLDRQIEVVPRGAFHRSTEVVPHDALRRMTLDVFQGDISRQHREVDPRGSLHRHFEISHEYALFPPDAYQRPIGTITQETLSHPRINSLSRRTSVHSLTASTSKNDPVTIKQPLSVSEDDNREVVFKILCSTESAGGVIGPGGTIIRTLQSESGASIHMGDTLADCDECLIAITASENPQDQNSPAQRAIVLVFSRIYEIATEKALDSGLRSSITARLVVHTNQIGFLRGKRGWIVSKMENRTGTFIKVLKVAQNPKCVAENNQVVQISGEFPNVKEAIYHVTSRLREFPNVEEAILSCFQRGSHYLVNYYKPVDADHCIRPEVPSPNRFSPTSMDLNDIFHHSSQAPSPPPAAPRGVNDATRTDLGLGSRHKSSNVTNITMEIKVPENAVNFLFGYGEDGRNPLQNLTQITGVRVIGLEPYLGTSDWFIAISGTPDQIQAAQYVLHAFNNHHR